MIDVTLGKWIDAENTMANKDHDVRPFNLTTRRATQLQFIHSGCAITRCRVLVVVTGFLAGELE